MAKQMSLSLTGKQFDLIPHTGVEVYGIEYFFGGGVQGQSDQPASRSRRKVSLRSGA
jgi:hypothetical protein